MILYAESSAVLAWLLGEADSAAVHRLLSEARVVFASRLTIAECERALARLHASNALSASETAVLREALARAASHWMRYEISPSVLARTGQPFPVEPIRTLDAIHLATAMELRGAEPRLEVVTLDARVRSNAEQLGLRVWPGTSLNGC